MSENKLTIHNYQENTIGIASLAPEWQPTEKNLKANGMLAMWFEKGHQLSLPAEDEGSRRLFEQLLAYAWNDTKLPVGSPEREAILRIQAQIGYDFANERLLLQALTRRSYHQDDPMLRGADCEVLELVGDSVLSSCVYRILLRQYGHFSSRGEAGKLFFGGLDEGKLSRIKQRYTSKDFLAGRCAALGFDRFIRYGKDDDRSKPDAREDTMEAIIGAAAVDSEWDMAILEDVVEKLLDIHLTFDPWKEEEDDFDRLNGWWQKRFGSHPVYKTERSAENAPDGSALYTCELRFCLSALDSGRDWEAWMAGKEKDFLWRPDIWGDEVAFFSRRISRSEARTMCASAGIDFLKKAGIFMNLKDTGIRPNPEDAINQLQILHQRGYVGAAKYDFIDCDDGWECFCTVDTFQDGVDAAKKKDAKKLAAFAVLIMIMRSAGIDDAAWDQQLGDALEAAQE